MVSIAYLTRINFFSDKAHVHTITKTCEALAQEKDISFTLVSVDNSLSNKKLKSDFFIKHGVEKPFSVVSLNSLSNKWKNSSNFFIYNIGTLWANFSLLNYVLKNRKKIDVVYFRDHLILPVILFARYFLGKKVVYESHYILTKPFGQWLTERSVSVSDAVVAIAGGLRDYYLKFNSNIIVSFCTSSEKDKFKTDHNRNYFREKLSFITDLFYLVYTGIIDVTGNGDSYGVEDILKALPLLPPDTVFVVVGKKTEGVHALEKQAESLGVSERFICVPWVSREKAVEYMLSSDILLIPKSGAKPGNSPSKMFEYLGTSRPIVAANTVPMREVLHDRVNSVLVDYTDPKAWAEAVTEVREKQDLRDSIVKQALLDAEEYTWEARGRAIAALIKEI